MKTVEEFKEHYERELMPALNELNGRRKKVAGGVVAVAVVGLALMVSPLAVGMIASVVAPDSAYLCCCLGAVPFFAGVAVIGFGNGMVTKGYRKDYKDQVVGKVVKFIDEGLEYRPSQGIETSAYHDSKIFLTHVDRYHSEDFISGTVGKTKVEFSEVHAEYKTEYRDSKGHRHTQWHTIFRGIFFVADFNKDFKGLTLVVPDTAQKLFGSLVGSFFQSHSIGRPDLVKMEDPEFEKLFVVYGNDQVEARYILSPSLMQRLVEYKKKTGKTLHFSFNKSQVYVAIPYNKDLFEPRIFRTLMDYDEVKGYFEDLKLVTSIVDELNLNTRIWSKT
ncbi:MAG: DUF3137 domain-containing protein [Candidatus Altiarchaeota archaeon]